ncbi:MAG: hypothetical protein HY887_07730 [Deltaproteobacteria bacterium]|nr:hypothetical protein [Deltaproteobacteria bacterium]
MKALDRGSAVLIEVEFRKQTPFGTAALFDPTAPKVTITDAAGVERVTDAALTRSALGQYYYICQTATGWATGVYAVKVTSSDGGYADVTIGPGEFGLR